MSELQRALRAAISLLMLSGVAEPAEGPRLPKIKDFHLTTSLVTNGKASAVIISPDTPEYQKLAKQVQLKIVEFAGVKLDIVADTQAAAGAEGANAILIGNFMTNKVSASLYCMEYLDVDAEWPGKGGYLLQTVHNPFGDGRNFISLGGGDFSGVKASAEALLKKFRQGKNLAVGQLYELKTSVKTPGALPEASIEKVLRSLKGKGYRNIGSSVARYGSIIRKYRTAGYARLFRKSIGMLWEEMDKLPILDDLRTTKFLPIIWDNIEESKEFTDDDREFVSNFMYTHAHKVLYAQKDVRTSAQPHGNNWNARGTYIAGAYFLKYYPDLEIGRRIMERMDRYYKSNVVHWKVAEDCPGYGDITLNANLFYALTRPDMSYFKSGNVRKAADYDILITTNLGTMSGFGDAGGLGRKYAVGVLPMAAWYYRDGSYLWWFRKCGGKSSRFVGDDLEEKPPAHLLGVKAIPVDRWIYERRKPRTMPIEKTFDKMSFRAGFNPDQQYLLMSGYSYGFHSHPDGNAIVNFSDNGHTFLFDDGYMVPEMSEHNTVVVYRNGRGGSLPELVQLDHLADFENVGLSESSVSGYNGVRWSRNVIWEKERYFLVVDEMEAEVDAEFSFQCVWRTKGEVLLKGRELTANQEGQVMHLVNLSGSTQSIKECHFKHPFGRRLVQTVPAKLRKGEKAVIANLFYVRGPDEAELSVESGNAGTALVRTDAGTALIGTGPVVNSSIETDASLFHASSTRIYAAGVSTFKWPNAILRASKPVSIDIDCKSGSAIIEAAESAKVEFPEFGQTIEVEPGQTRVKFKPAEADALAMRKNDFSQRFSKQESARKTQESSALTGGPLNVVPLWHYDQFDLLLNQGAGRKVTIKCSQKALSPAESHSSSRGVAHVAEPGANVMFPVGKQVVFDFDLGVVRDVRRVVIRSRQLVTFRGGCGVSKMTVELSDDGFEKDRRLFGSRAEQTMPPQNQLVVYRIEGKPSKARFLRFTFDALTPNHRVYIDSLIVEGLATAEERKRKGFSMRWMKTGDLDGDGIDEVITGASDDCVYALDTNGKRRWKAEIGGRIYQLAADDLDGDGKAEVVVASNDRRLYCFNGDGSIRWNIAPPPRTYARPHYRGVLPFTGPLKVVFADDLDGDGKKEIAVGAGNWRVYCYSHEGKLLWDECNWAHQPTCGDAFDLDGDGIREVMMGNDYGYSHTYHGKTGKIVQTVRMTSHAGPSALDADDVQGDGKGDLVLGDRMGRITFCYPWNTKQRSSINVGAPITFARLVDLDRDGSKEAVLGADNGYLYVFDEAKKLRWQTNMGEVPRDMATADLDSNGRLDLLIACEDNKLHILDADGREIGNFAVNGRMRQVRMAELDGKQNTIEFIIASDDGIHALRWKKAL